MTAPPTTRGQYLNDANLWAKHRRLTRAIGREVRQALEAGVVRPSRVEDGTVALGLLEDLARVYDAREREALRAAADAPTGDEPS